MGHLLSRPIRPSLTKLHQLRSELSALKHGNVIYTVGCGFMAWMLFPTSFILGASLALVSTLSCYQYLDRTRDSFLLTRRRDNPQERPPENSDEELLQEYNNLELESVLNRKSFLFSMGKLPLLGMSLLGCFTTGNILGGALLCAAVGYSTKQALKSVHKWDDARLHKAQVKRDLIRLTQKAHPPKSQDARTPLPDLSLSVAGVTAPNNPPSEPTLPVQSHGPSPSSYGAKLKR